MGWDSVSPDTDTTTIPAVMRHTMKVIVILLTLSIVGPISLSFLASGQSPDCDSPDIEKIDSCLVGLPLKDAIATLKIDTSQFFAFDEPPGILRGIYITQSDTCKIRIYVERTSIINKLDSFPNWRMNYLHIIDKKIVGVTWKKQKKNKGKSVGFRIAYWHDLEH